jgi:hypothetical protein
MRLARIVRGMTTLKEAELEFVLQVNKEGYVVECDLDAYWISDTEILVQANIRKEGDHEGLV